MFHVKDILPLSEKCYGDNKEYILVLPIDYLGRQSFG